MDSLYKQQGLPLGAPEGAVSEIVVGGGNGAVLEFLEDTPVGSSSSNVRALVDKAESVRRESEGGGCGPGPP